MCAKAAGLVLKVLSDLLGHENHEVGTQPAPWAGGGAGGGARGWCALPPRGVRGRKLHPSSPVSES